MLGLEYVGNGFIRKIREFRLVKRIKEIPNYYYGQYASPSSRDFLMEEYYFDKAKLCYLRVVHNSGNLKRNIRKFFGAYKGLLELDAKDLVCELDDKVKELYSLYLRINLAN